MALDPALGLPKGADLEALFDVLRQQAFTREIDDASEAPRDGLGLKGDWITINIYETSIEVRAATRHLRATRGEAFADAEALLDAIDAAGPWTAHRGGWIGVHPARKYTPSLPTNELAAWFAAVSAILEIHSTQ